MICDINRISKPVGEHYDQPEGKRAKQVLNNKKFYWQGINQRPTPADKLLARARSAKRKPHSQPSHFLLAMILSGQCKLCPSQLNAALTNKTVIRKSNCTIRVKQTLEILCFEAAGGWN